MAIKNRGTTGRWLALLTGSALAHGAAIAVLPTVLSSPLPSPTQHDALTVTLLQISPPAVEQRHPARRSLHVAKPSASAPVALAASVAALREVPIETPPSTRPKTAPQTSRTRLVAAVETAVDNTPRKIAPAPADAMKTPVPATSSAPLAAPTPPKARIETAVTRSAPVSAVKTTAAVAEPVPLAVNAVERATATDNVVEPHAFDNEFDDELEEDDNAPYAEPAPAASNTVAAAAVAAAVAVAVAVGDRTSTPDEPHLIKPALDTAAGNASTEPNAMPDALSTTAPAQDIESTVATPTPVPLPASATAVAGTTPTASFDDTIIRREIHARFDHNLVYPPLARKRGWEGNVDVMLRVSRHGNIEVLEVVESSGFGILDRYTRKTLEHIRLDDQFLESLQGSHRDLRIEVQYQLLASRG